MSLSANFINSFNGRVLRLGVGGTYMLFMLCSYDRQRKQDPATKYPRLDYCGAAVADNSCSLKLQNAWRRSQLTQ